MNYVDSFELFGVKAKQIPSIVGSGAPDYSTYGAVGCLYMDRANGKLYKCIGSDEGLQSWQEIGAGGDSDGNIDAALENINSALDVIIAIQDSLIGGDLA